MDGKWSFPHLNGASYYMLADQTVGCIWGRMITIMICLKTDENLRLITPDVERDIVHLTKGYKSAKQIQDAFYNLFGMVNTTQVNQLETRALQPQNGRFPYR